MKSNTKTRFNLLLIILFIGITLMSCGKDENSVQNYLEDAELQYEGIAQEENIITALNDILNLSEEQLKTKTYQDYSGKENEWDLQTLIYKHFVPSEKGKTVGNNFYNDIKTNEVQEKIKWFLKNLDHKNSIIRGKAEH
ncbi:hypothetical protein KAU15_01580 [candidate division WOR-3 bacterium]|nr:hypothetical protein [candidate division WOR-3 bacterium]